MYTFIDWFIYVHVYEQFCSVTSMPPIFTSRCGDAYQPRLLWSPDFPLIQEEIPLLPSLLDEADMQLSYHLFHTLGLGLGETNCCRLMVPLAGIKLTKHREPMMLGLNLTDVLPTAWLSTFGKWLPFEQLVEVVPFLAASGLPGFLAITIVILTSRLGQRQWNFKKTRGFCTFSMFLLFGGWACATAFNLCAS